MANFMPGTKGLGRECRAGHDLVPEHSVHLGDGRRERWRHPYDPWKVQNITRESQKKVRRGRASWRRRTLTGLVL